jgi:hypothetical protein
VFLLCGLGEFWGDGLGRGCLLSRTAVGGEVFWVRVSRGEGFRVRADKGEQR